MTESADPPSLRDRIERGLAASFWRLDLPGSLEQQYRVAAMGGRIDQTLRSAWLAMLVFNSFLIVDWLMVRDVFWFSAAIRLVVFMPLCMATFILGAHFKAAIMAREATFFTDWIIVISGWGAALCMAAILYKSHSPYAMYYHAGFMVIVIYGNAVQQLAFRYAILFSLVVLGLNTASVTLFHDYPAPIRLAMIELLGGTVFYSLTANYLVEKARRRRYLLMRREGILVEDLRKVNRRLQRLSRSDVLTGVANRRHFHDHVRYVWDRTRISQKPLSVLMIDVDHFKGYNDCYGHPSGDEALRQVAQAVERHLRRPEDFVARYGGEEFIAVLPDADADVAELAAERVRLGVEGLRMRHEASSAASVVTVSIGVATLLPGVSGATPEQLVAGADHALYEAKRAGRNRVKVMASV